MITESQFEERFDEFDKPSEEMLEFLASEFGGVKGEDGNYTFAYCRDIAGRKVLREVNVWLTEHTFWGCKEFHMQFSVKTKIDGVDCYNERFYEDMACWTWRKFDYLANDWSEFPEELNEKETIIKDALLKMFPEGKAKIHVKVCADDSVRQFGFSLAPFSVESCARGIYDSVASCYRDHITGAHQDTKSKWCKEDVYLDFDNEDFYKDMEKYISDKSAWCAKYGCD